MISKDGTYDSLGYSMSKVSAMLPFVKKNTALSFLEYRQQKKNSAKNTMWHILISGIFWILIAIVFLIIYYTVF
jgi:hypothetical protein